MFVQRSWARQRLRGARGARGAKVVDNKVIDSRFKTFGCGSAIAASSLATEWVIGKSVEEALEVSNRDLAAYLRLPPVKLHCSMLAESAIKTALEA